MFAVLGSLAVAAAGYFLKGNGGGLLSGDVNVTIDVWERNKTMFVLFFFLIAALIISRL